MERLVFNNKVYVGNKIFYRKGAKDEITVYSLNALSDKFLILNKKDTVKDFIITGVDKVYHILSLLEDKDKKEQELYLKVKEYMKTIKEQCYIQNRVDTIKFKELVGECYDQNYSDFVFLGIKFFDLLNDR